MMGSGDFIVHKVVDFLLPQIHERGSHRPVMTDRKISRSRSAASPGAS